MFISGNNCLTQILFLLCQEPPVHLRGTLMRCHGRGPGCGPRERHATHVTAPGGTREASPRQKDRGLGPTGRERESGRCRVARRVGAAHPLMRQDPAIRVRPERSSGPSGVIRTTRLLGASLPSLREEGNRRTPPTPVPQEG